LKKILKLTRNAFLLFLVDSRCSANEARIQKIADEMAAARALSGKPKAVMKSALILDVKPWEDTTGKF
jgi:hypothetical protein